ncbi:MAG: TIGR02281 family clan AA aspartic protease [Novosphingobium sp.]|nr:TIGR02281 family clan AA aspartic protease [Novosphingobium sp.]
MSEIGEMLSSQPLLLLAVAGVLIAMAGWQLQHSSPQAGSLLRKGGYLAMAAALMLTAGLAAYRSDKSDAALDLAKMPEIIVQGDETAIPLNIDGHYWVRAKVNGKPVEFMVDTGATFTSLTGSQARNLGLEPTSDRMPAQFDTANGTAPGRFTTIPTLEFGTIRADALEAVIMINDDGDTNVIGMNLLSELKSWRVEDETLTLVPHHSAQN